MFKIIGVRAGGDDTHGLLSRIAKPLIPTGKHDCLQTQYEAVAQRLFAQKIKEIRTGKPGVSYK